MLAERSEQTIRLGDRDDGIPWVRRCFAYRHRRGIGADRLRRHGQNVGKLGSDPREGIFQAAVEAGWVLLELAEEKASLEDIFVRLTTREEPGDGQEEAEEVVS